MAHVDVYCGGLRGGLQLLTALPSLLNGFRSMYVADLGRANVEVLTDRLTTPVRLEVAKYVRTAPSHLTMRRNINVCYAALDDC